MRDLFFCTNPSASPEQGANVPASQEIGKAIFIHTTARYFAVTALLWFGIVAVTASCWFSAWSLGVAFARWMGS